MNQISVVNCLLFEFDIETACPTGIPNKSLWIFESETPGMKHDLYQYIDKKWSLQGSFVTYDLAYKVAEAIEFGLLAKKSLLNDCLSLYKSLVEFSDIECKCTPEQLVGFDPKPCIHCQCTTLLNTFGSEIINITNDAQIVFLEKD